MKCNNSGKGIPGSEPFNRKPWRICFVCLRGGRQVSPSEWTLPGWQNKTDLWSDVLNDDKCKRRFDFFLPARRQNLSTTNNKTAMRFLSRQPGCGVRCFVTLLHINTCYTLWNDRKLFFPLRRFSQRSLITFHEAKIIHHWAFCAVPGQKPKKAWQMSLQSSITFPIMHCDWCDPSYFPTVSLESPTIQRCHA